MVFLVFGIILLVAGAYAIASAVDSSERAADKRFWNNLYKKIEEARNDFA